ncbi:sensor histidine kinase [Sphingomonas sp. PL-96]|uniref:ATP-binding protein n=1 Tax=Sphingomonas sp. PL-96 TaxID=2887201 RepID=UPI001E4D0FB3|nr:ATP-binding protein [Sphingomonas sp. PL-96]MCC2976081.1 sensor histidine kinase [Sphingomonas sp. PL-96]
MASRTRSLAWILLALALPLLAAWIAGQMAERNAWGRLRHEAHAAAQLRQALLTSELQRFQLLPLALSDDALLPAAMRRDPAALRALNRKLEALAVEAGAATIYVLGLDGVALAASNWRSPQSFVGQDYGFRSYYQEARDRGAYRQFALGTVSHKPGLYLSRRVAGGGFVVVKVEFDALERGWARAGGIAFVADGEGVILVTSQSAWRFRTTHVIEPAAAQRIRREMRLGPHTLAPLPVPVANRRAGLPSVFVNGERYLAVRLPPQAGGWRLSLLMPTRSVVGETRGAQAAALFAALVLVTLGWILRERARRGTEAAGAAKARAAELAELVEARTAALRREIEERAETEAQAEVLREELRQANRLATLGQVTASVAHETAQPIAAIRNYARAGRAFIARGRFTDADTNLTEIERLTERVGAVTAELRGFARKASGPVAPMPLARSIDGAMLILRERLSGVTFVRPTVPPDLTVLGDPVRVEQVLINLLQNALDATGSVVDPRITLDLDTAHDCVRIDVRDNGAGVDPAIAERIFTPFVTSRTAGLGLGLVIAQDIMIDMGGSLHLMPSSGGAWFQVRLRRAAA